jgi:hypothetical protein
LTRAMSHALTGMLMLVWQSPHTHTFWWARL